MQVCDSHKSLFADRINLNMLCDIPGVFIAKLEKLAQGQVDSLPAAAEDMDATGLGMELETPRGTATEADFGAALDSTGKGGKRKGDSISVLSAGTLLPVFLSAALVAASFSMSLADRQHKQLCTRALTLHCPVLLWMLQLWL